MIAEQAAANGAEFVDTYAESVGHDVCTLPPTRWFEGLVPTVPAYPIHPNALGEASMARSVLRVLGQPQPARARRAGAHGARGPRGPRRALHLHAEPRGERDVRAAALAAARGRYSSRARRAPR